MVLVTMLLTALATVLIYRYFFAPKPFDAVELSEREQHKLEAKLDRLLPGRRSSESAEDGSMQPQPYSEEGASRMVHFNEREVNALLARNTDLADKLAVDLADELVSAQLLLPLHPDFPVMGGKTVRVHAGLNLSFKNDRPVAILRGVSVMGVPVPNAWLGGLKNIDLVEQFGGSDGFWKSLAEGIESLEVENGKISIQLAE
ncbi:MAG: arginine N-succinyltransferase [Gammaproteobacteria bacterium]|nr:arginine N-succinyltransferase [Gammaproteobacteria bacterium]NND39435.1 arginine N-succinyltransferase [Pseudomonadales bacterium]MBT8150422.1 arginine N-succinyltransferase [Gammaproteobacteria bacterium]NNL11906.1 arginine N-succinyltransferase [Pseudomonadales bacterium]NNM11776.1 arginine N-succinyltransferase [Pseudomonadales bacterium]